MFSLILTFVILFVIRRKIKSDRTYIQLNLVAALLFFHITSLFHNLAVQHPRTCEVAAVALHLFTLATGKTKKLIYTIKVFFYLLLKVNKNTEKRNTVLVYNSRIPSKSRYPKTILKQAFFEPNKKNCLFALQMTLYEYFVEILCYSQVLFFIVF